MTRLLLAAVLSIPALTLAADAPAQPSKPALASVTTAPAKSEPRAETMYVHLTGEDGRAVKVPLFAESSAVMPVARVDSDVITVEELTEALGAAHEGVASEAHAGHKDFAPILQRLVEVKLVLLEAKDMGLDDLPEIKKAVDQYQEKALLEALQRQALAGVKPDPAEVERLFKEKVREWKLRSVLIPNLGDAKAFVASVRGGKKTFEDAAKALVAQKKGKGAPVAEFVSADHLQPVVATSVTSLKVGGVSDPIHVQEGYAVVKLEDLRYPENAKARAEAEEAALGSARKVALKKYYDGLLAKYAKTDKALLKSIDYEAKKPGFEALLKDERVVSRIEGGKPVTVAEVTSVVQEQFFHGVDRAIKEKKINRQKEQALDVLLSRRIVPLEARRLELEKTPAYKKAVADFTRNSVFTLFVEKAILPDVKVTDDQVKKYYESHKADFTGTPFYKLENIVFSNVKSAQTALDKLRSGTDFKWLRANAEGQVSEAERTVRLEGETLSAKGMPEDLAKLLAGSKKGDYRLYAGDKGQSHVIRVVDAIPPDVQPFDEVKEPIRKKLYDEQVNKGIRTFAEKLRKAHPVKVYITKIGV